MNLRDETCPWENRGSMTVNSSRKKMFHKIEKNDTRTGSHLEAPHLNGFQGRNVSERALKGYTRPWGSKCSARIVSRNIAFISL